MSKIIAIGDIHGHASWKYILQKEKDADVIVFVGDYFDSFELKAEEQIRNFRELMEQTENNPKIIRLIGNHKIF